MTTDENSEGSDMNERKSSSQNIMSQEKYFSDLEKWLQDAYMWQGVAASFPYFLMCNQHISRVSSNNIVGNVVNYPNSFTYDVSGRGNVGFQTNPVALGYGIECKIPPFWKRIVAELLDFLILFILKLAVTWIAIDFFDIIDLGKFDFEGLHLGMKKLDYRVALEMTHNIMILEVVHRVIVCIFETFWLVGGVAGQFGGATPGKTIMGLRVVQCVIVAPLSESEDSAIVYPGTDLGLGKAFARSFIKNLILALFIPFVIAFYYFPFNRAGYDMVCNTIVIEGPIIQRRPNVR